MSIDGAGGVLTYRVYDVGGACQCVIVVGIKCQVDGRSGRKINHAML